MTTLEVRASVLRDIASLMDDDNAMLQLQDFLTSLKNKLGVGVKSYRTIAAREEFKCELREALQEVWDAKEGKTTLRNAEELLYEL